MRCGSGNGVEDLAVGGLPANEVVPSSFPEQTAAGSNTGLGRRRKRLSRARRLKVVAPLARSYVRWTEPSVSSLQGKLEIDRLAFPVCPWEAGEVAWGTNVPSSGVLSMAQADVTKHAREIPMNRRINIASFSLAYPRTHAALSRPAKYHWQSEEMQIDVSPVLCSCL
jgi:hypothetical protein